MITLKDVLQSGKKIVCFGAGPYARELMDKPFFSAINISYFTDNDCEKWGGGIAGYKILPPEKLFSENAADTIVFITSGFFDEIIEQLKRNGFEQYFIYKNEESDYLKMQSEFYNLPSISPQGIVGSYDFHENFPYETLLLYENGDIRKPIFNDFKSKKAFDICCGEGRMVRRMKSVFGEVDGADMSEKMISAAIENTPGSRFYVTDGNNCGKAESDYYDFAYCTISLQHICSYTIRDKITRDLARILNKDGKLTFQMLYSSNGFYVPVAEMSAEGYLNHLYSHNIVHASFFQDKFYAHGTNSTCDVLITLSELESIKEYFNRYFEEVSFWFWDISIGREGYRGSRKLDRTHPNSHLSDNYIGTHFIFIHCAKPKNKI